MYCSNYINQGIKFDTDVYSIVLCRLHSFRYDSNIEVVVLLCCHNLSSYHVRPYLMENISTANYTEPTPIQMQAIPLMLNVNP